MPLRHTCLHSRPGPCCFCGQTHPCWSSLLSAPQAPESETHTLFVPAPGRDARRASWVAAAGSPWPAPPSPVARNISVRGCGPARQQSSDGVIGSKFATCCIIGYRVVMRCSSCSPVQQSEFQYPARSPSNCALRTIYNLVMLHGTAQHATPSPHQYNGP
jgi:hypothetical protein